MLPFFFWLVDWILYVYIYTYIIMWWLAITKCYAPASRGFIIHQKSDAASDRTYQVTGVPQCQRSKWWENRGRLRSTSGAVWNFAAEWPEAMVWTWLRRDSLGRPGMDVFCVEGADLPGSQKQVENPWMKWRFEYVLIGKWTIYIYTHRRNKCLTTRG
jgi:hypothetical protein